LAAGTETAFTQHGGNSFFCQQAEQSIEASKAVGKWPFTLAEYYQQTH
jgi:hypothetical protein